MMQFTFSTFLHGKLEEAGIPIDGCSWSSKKTVETDKGPMTQEAKYEIHFREEATDEQKAQAQAIADDCLSRIGGIEAEWNAQQAEIDKYGSEKNLKFANALKDKGVFTEEELEKIFG